MGGQGFRVDPESLALLSDLVKRQGMAAEVYVELELPEDDLRSEAREGILFTVWPVVDRWQELGRMSTQQGADLATAAGEGLHNAAVLYREVDFDHAALLDDSYGPAVPYDRADLPGWDAVRRTWWLVGGSPAPFTDYVDLDEFRSGNREDTELQKELLRAGEEVAAEAARIMGVASFFGQYRGLLKDILGLDPWTEVSKVAIGDWKALTEEGLDFAGAAATFDGIRLNIDQGRCDIQDLWTGVAASQALSWLEQYSSACTQHAEFMRTAAEKILHLARAVYHWYVAFNGTLDAAVDALLSFLVGGPIVAGFGRVLALARGENPLEVAASVVLAFKSVSAAIGQYLALVHDFIGIAEVVAGTGDAALANWPARPYEHPSFE
jgi:uncharacterized protein YukE